MNTSVPNQYHGGALRHVWSYRGVQGEEVALVARYDQLNGKKECIPFRPDGRGGWKMGALPNPHPLYGLNVIHGVDPERAIVIVEGEKCASALQSIGILGVTWQGGANAVSKADWSPLNGRGRVFIMPDRDDPGESAAEDVLGCLSVLGDPPAIFRVDLTGLSEGGDVVDWLMSRISGWNGFDPVANDDVARVRAELLETIKRLAVPFEVATMSDEEWPEITPLPARGEMSESEPYPVGILPPALRDAAKEVARFSQVPAASPAIIGLSAICVAIREAAQIHERQGLSHWPSIFACLIAESGERKTPSFKSMCAPLEEWERDAEVGHEVSKRAAGAKNEAIDAALSGIRSKAKKAGDIDAFAEEVADLEAKRPAAPVRPRLFTSNVTEERLFQLMYERNGAFAVMSGEGRPVIDGILGQYSGPGRTGDAIYLAGISGDTITRDRVGAQGTPEERVIRDPCLSVCIMVQPDKYLEAASHPGLRASGALARIWPAWLPRMAGTRFEKEDDPGLDISRLASYRQIVRRILDHTAPQDDDGKPQPHIARLCSAAAAARRNYHNAVEAMMAEGGDLEDVRDIASKAVSQTAKMALVLHIFERPEVMDTEESEISLETWAVAQTLGTWHLQEAVRVQRLASENPELEGARRVLAWLARERPTVLKGSMIQQYGPRPRPSAREAAAILDLLEEHGYLQRAIDATARKPVYRLHPGLADTAGLAGPGGAR